MCIRDSRHDGDGGSTRARRGHPHHGDGGGDDARPRPRGPRWQRDRNGVEGLTKDCLLYTSGFLFQGGQVLLGQLALVLDLGNVYAAESELGGVVLDLTLSLIHI